jgi:hypothetical protein
MTAATQPSIEQIVLGAIPVCGSTRNVEVGHMDGHEENTAPANLIWNCRSCNTRIGEVFKRAGLGEGCNASNRRGSGRVPPVVQLGSP